MDEVAGEQSASATCASLAKNCDRQIARAAGFHEFNKLLRLVGGWWMSTANREALEFESRRLEHRALAVHVEKTNKRTNSSSVNLRKIILVSIKRAAAFQLSFGMNEGQGHAGKHAVNRPPKLFVF